MIVFTRQAYEKLKALLSLAEQKLSNWEIHGFGRIELEEGIAYCTDIDMPEQEAKQAHIDTTGHEFLRWQQRKLDLRSGMTDEEIAEANAEMRRWRLWWHSHGNMGASYSGTDHDTLKTLAEATGDYFLGLVTTSKLSTKCYLAQISPLQIISEFGELALERVAQPEIESWADEQFRRVRKFQPAPAQPVGASNPVRPSTGGSLAVVKATEAAAAKAGANTGAIHRDGDAVGDGLTKLSLKKRKHRKGDSKHPNDMELEIFDGSLPGSCPACFGQRAAGRLITHMPSGTLKAEVINVCLGCELPEDACICQALATGVADIGGVYYGG